MGYLAPFSSLVGVSLIWDGIFSVWLDESTQKCNAMGIGLQVYLLGMKCQS